MSFHIGTPQILSVSSAWRVHVTKIPSSSKCEHHPLFHEIFTHSKQNFEYVSLQDFKIFTADCNDQINPFSATHTDILF